MRSISAFLIVAVLCCGGCKQATTPANDSGVTTGDAGIDAASLDSSTNQADSSVAADLGSGDANVIVDAMVNDAASDSAVVSDASMSVDDASVADAFTADDAMVTVDAGPDSVPCGDTVCSANQFCLESSPGIYRPGAPTRYYTCTPIPMGCDAATFCTACITSMHLCGPGSLSCISGKRDIFCPGV